MKYLALEDFQHYTNKIVVGWSTLYKLPSDVESECSCIRRYGVYGVIIELEKTCVFVPDIRLVGEEGVIDFYSLPNTTYYYQQQSLDYTFTI